MKDKIFKRAIAIGLVILAIGFIAGAIASAGIIAKLIVRLFMFGFNLI